MPLATSARKSRNRREYALSLTKAPLMQGDIKELVSRLWNVTPTSRFEDVECNQKNQLAVPVNVGIAGHVATSKLGLKVANVYDVSFIYVLLA